MERLLVARMRPCRVTCALPLGEVLVYEAANQRRFLRRGARQSIDQTGALPNPVKEGIKNGRKGGRNNNQPVSSLGVGGNEPNCILREANKVEGRDQFPVTVIRDDFIQEVPSRAHLTLANV